MILYRAVGLVAEGWALGASAMRSAPKREPFLVVGTAQLLVLIGLGYFHVPTLVPLLEPVVRWVGGEAATHFPEHFWILPELYRTANAVLASVLAGIAYGVAVSRLAGRQTPWSEGWRHAPTLVAIGTFHFAGAWTITSLFNLIPPEITLLSFVIRIGFQGIELALILALHSALLFAPAAVVLEGRDLGAALERSVQIGWRHFLPVVLLVGLPLALLFPPTFFLYEMSAEEAGVPPASIGLMMTGLIALRVVFDVLVLGGVARLFPARERGPR